MTDLTIEQRVANGAELLDSVRPGWAAKIDVERLNLVDCDECVLGQLFATFEIGCIELGFPVAAAAADYGFQHSVPIPPHMTEEAAEAYIAACDAEFAALRTAWIDAIRSRLSVPAPVLATSTDPHSPVPTTDPAPLEAEPDDDDLGEEEDDDDDDDDYDDLDEDGDPGDPDDLAGLARDWELGRQNVPELVP